MTAFAKNAKSSPKNIEIGSAGKALRQMANSTNVRHNPCVRNFRNEIYSIVFAKEMQTYNENGNKAGQRCVPVSVTGRLSHKDGVEYEIAKT